MLEVMRSVLLCMQEVVEGGFCLMEVAEVAQVMRCVLLCILEAVKGALCLPEVLEVLDVPEVIRCVPLLCWRL